MSADEAETFHMPFVAYRVAKQQKSKKQQKISFASPPNIKMCII